MSTPSIHLKYRTPKRYPTIISNVPPGMALIVAFRGSNYRCLEQIFMVPKASSHRSSTDYGDWGISWLSSLTGVYNCCRLG